MRGKKVNPSVQKQLSPSVERAPLQLAGVLEHVTSSSFHTRCAPITPRVASMRIVGKDPIPGGERHTDQLTD